MNYITDTLYVKVEESMNNIPNVDKKLSKIIDDYISRNIDALNTTGPVHRITFTDAERDKVMNLLKIQPSEITKIIRGGKNINIDWKILNKPFTILSAVLIRYYAIQNNTNMVNKCVLYYTLSAYQSYHYKYFRYGVQENVMAYTISNMSNKYKIKTAGSLLDTLFETGIGSFNNYKDELLSGTDNGYILLIMGIHTRVNSLLKNITKEYMKNYKDKNYLNLDTDDPSDETYSESESNLKEVYVITQRVLTQLVSNGINYKFCDLAASMCNVSRSDVRNYVDTIVVNNKNVGPMIESICNVFLMDNPVSDIKTSKFLISCLNIYKKSNTKDKNILRIKTILDEWISDIGLYKKTQREATISNFRKALFVFFVLTIQDS